MKHITPSCTDNFDAAISAAHCDIETASAEDIIRLAQVASSTDRLAVVSSFGAESAVLLHLVSQINPAIPVLFLDTQHHFEETQLYKRKLIDRLGLLDVRAVSPDTSVSWIDPDKSLYRSNPDLCCDLRKARPMRAALRNFDAWITGRKRFQTTQRSAMSVVEHDADGRLKFNPLANWTPDDIERHFKRHLLPCHPLTKFGYRSVGCAPCTSPTRNGEDARNGRWRGCSKTECGIHINIDGKTH